MPRFKSSSDNGSRVSAKYWLAVLYPENMIENWKVEIGDVLQYPYAYCVHDKDRQKNGDPRKEHVHMILAFSNTTTENHAMNIFNKLSARGKRALNKIMPAVNVRHSYDYLIHDTETSRKLKKYQYQKKERVTGNNFDIGDYEQVSQADKDRMLKELCDFIVDNNLTNFADAYIQISAEFDSSYFSVLKSYSGLLERISRGMFLRAEKEIAAIKK